MASEICTVPTSEILEKGLAPDVTKPVPYVIVVDDEPVIANTLAAVLRGYGYAVTAVYDGNSALQIAELAPPDLLITDVFMPGMDGIELAVRVCKVAPNCKVLLWSGQPERAVLMASARMAGHKFRLLPKPICPRELLKSLTTDESAITDDPAA